MDINTDRVCEACSCDWRGGPFCPVCGYLDNVDGIITACAWCDSRHAIMAEAKVQGLEVSHGICQMHEVAFNVGRAS